MAYQTAPEPTSPRAAPTSSQTKNRARGRFAFEITSRLCRHLENTDANPWLPSETPADSIDPETVRNDHHSFLPTGSEKKWEIEGQRFLGFEELELLRDEEDGGAAPVERDEELRLGVAWDRDEELRLGVAWDRDEELRLEREAVLRFDVDREGVELGRDAVLRAGVLELR